jgi:hypothetical protein
MSYPCKCGTETAPFITCPVCETHDNKRLNAGKRPQNKPSAVLIPKTNKNAGKHRPRAGKQHTKT